MIKLWTASIVVIIIASSMPQGALTITLSPLNKTIDVNQSIHFSNTTQNGTSPYTWYYKTFNTQGISLENNTYTFTQTGEYVIFESVFDSVGNYSTATATIHVNPNPKVSISPLNASVIIGKNETLTAKVSGGTPPYTYQWYNKSGCYNVIGNTNSSKYLTEEINVTQTYCVTIKDNYSQIASAKTTLTPVTKLINESSIAQVVNNSLEILPPSITTIANGVLVANLTPGEAPILPLCGTNQEVIEVSLSPNATVLDINSTFYNLKLGNAIALGSGCDAELTNVSWIPAIHTNKIALYTYTPPATTTIPSIIKLNNSTITANLVVNVTTSIAGIPITGNGTTTTISTTNQNSPHRFWGILGVVAVVAVVAGIYLWTGIFRNVWAE